MKCVLFIFFSTLLLACSQPAKEVNTNTDTVAVNSSPDTLENSSTSPQPVERFYQPTGDSVLFPPFSIGLKLSAKAEERLKNSNETVIISVTFEGKPKDTTDKFFQQWGYIVVGNSQVELQENRTATFSNVKISRAGYDSLASKDVDVLVDVFSGRHSSQNNLLDCEFLQAPISKVRQQTNVLTGKLIEE